MKTELNFQFRAIGFVQSPFPDRFGVPRQPRLSPEARGVLKFLPEAELKTALRDLDEFSHLWVVFVFHDHGGKSWKPSVRPPRLGGNRKVGVLSSRSPHRPNPIGISVFPIEKVDLEAKGGPEIHVSGLDLIDGTPILDVKPYLPYADSIPEATAGWAAAEIPKYPVTFSEEAQRDLETLAQPNDRQFITEILELDPRPAFQKRQMPVGSEFAGRKFGISLKGFDVQYEIIETGFLVTGIKPL